MDKKSIEVKLSGREQVHLELEVDDQGVIASASLKGIGGPQLMAHLVELRSKLQGKISSLPVPQGADPGSIVLREVILKAKGEWNFPFNEDELCHCRAVPGKVVDMAIIAGAHTPDKVRRMTSACTGCGTCQPNVEEMINYRLGRTLSKVS